MDEDDNVVPFSGITLQDVDPARICEEAAKSELTEVVVIGYEAGSGDLYFAASSGKPADVLFLLEHAKMDLMAQEVKLV